MTRPQWDAEEEYFVAFVRSSAAKRFGDPFSLGYLLAALVVFGFGVHTDTREMVYIAFAVAVGGRIWEMRAQRPWTMVLRGILEKYEAALDRCTVGKREQGGRPVEPAEP